jgi:hypothetical protein
MLCQENSGNPAWQLGRYVFCRSRKSGMTKCRNTNFGLQNEDITNFPTLN